MCELFAMVSKTKKKILPVLEDMVRRGFKTNNVHGWGLSYYKDTIPVLIKEAINIRQANVLKYGKIETDLMIGHIRELSVGEVRYENSHPFVFRKYIFAHNGTIQSPLHSNYVPKGDTDSEQLFLHLVEKIDIIGSIETAIVTVAKGLRGSKNFLFSDGNKLYAYGDNKLHYCKKGNTTLVATTPVCKGKWYRIRGLKVFE